MKRVVISGLGAISPLGLNVADTFNALVEGKSGVVKISRFDASEYPSQIAGEVQGFDHTPFISRKEAKKMDLFIQYALAAATEAIKDSGLDLEKEDLNRFGTIIGSGIGGLPMIETQHKILLEKGPRRVSPFFIPSLIINLAAGHVSIRFGLKGPNSAPATACATGAHAIGDAFRIIQRGEAEIMICGGSEAVVSPMAVSGFGSMKALSSRNDDPAAASRPFDMGRDGFVLGEGCGLLILEEYERAVKRGARIYAELKGYGMSSDAFHITSPSEDADGQVRVMRACLADAKLNPEDIDLVNAHGTSTPAGDAIESQAIGKVFSTRGDKMKVHSTKSMTGHLLGAAGGVESVVAIKTIETGQIHQTFNLEDQDPRCAFDAIKGAARDMPIKNIISNSFGFGGTNAALIFSKL